MFTLIINLLSHFLKKNSRKARLNDYRFQIKEVIFDEDLVFTMCRFQIKEIIFDEDLWFTMCNCESGKYSSILRNATLLQVQTH